MLIDQNLLDNLSNDPILHFYDWEETSLTYGYFIDIEKFLDLKKAKEKKLSIAKRPTGGGIVFHIWDIAFSFLMPKNNKNFFLDPLKNYQFVNEITLSSIKNFFLNDSELLKEEKVNEDINFFDSFCMAKPTKYDIVYKGKKILGAAQRRKKLGYLHQASICLVEPDITYLEEVLLEKNIAKAIKNSSFAIFDKGNIEEKRDIVKKSLIENFSKILS
ncbi:MAG: lipoate--protein ligase family protein [Parachlamydiales bacterium]|nr:lipoate--protein ligase family protein [Parachlamydiales bacterium]